MQEGFAVLVTTDGDGFIRSDVGELKVERPTLLIVLGLNGELLLGCSEEKKLDGLLQNKESIADQFWVIRGSEYERGREKVLGLL